MWTDDLDEDEKEVLPESMDDSFPFAQPAVEIDERDELWGLLGFPKKTQAENKKLIQQYRNALRTRGLEDDSEARVAAVRS